MDAKRMNVDGLWRGVKSSVSLIASGVEMISRKQYICVGGFFFFLNCVFL